MYLLQRFFRQISLVCILALGFVTAANAVTVEHIAGKTTINKVPQRIAVLGHGSLDLLNYLEIQPVGALHSLLPSYLKKYESTTVNTGSFHEPDFEALYTLKPDLIIVENRMVHLYEEISKIAPAVMFYVEDGEYWKNTQKNWRMLGKVLGREDDIEAKISATSKLISKASSQAKEQQLKALMLMNSGGNISMYNQGSRFSLVFDEFGFTDSSTTFKPTVNRPHGNLISFEYIKDAQPEVIFILDREQAIGLSEDKAKQQFNNALIKSTPASKNDKIVFIDPNAWYLTAGGITATDNIIKDVFKALD
ncbi:ABC transporter substrate-binding protein [Vibrio sp. SCSIO 43136]|uniref:siderophore ABC transporter substrate-binding protein n=1 Tax=Vibrio sp. SCSIO 43136 TaxID=2819101 RepID=UPI002075D06D|nr:ABC transporter substrate-binding protein [Vibrio sp. SCSIO 43136]USD67320.1 ABC transporter substrate-binding protein [Vibrio sp. SCSIO 43136]